MDLIGGEKKKSFTRWLWYWHCYLIFRQRQIDLMDFIQFLISDMRLMNAHHINIRVHIFEILCSSSTSICKVFFCIVYEFGDVSWAAFFFFGQGLFKFSNEKQKMEKSVIRLLFATFVLTLWIVMEIRSSIFIVAVHFVKTKKKIKSLIFARRLLNRKKFMDFFLCHISRCLMCV